MASSFQQLGIDPLLVAVLEKHGFERSTDVQTQTIPALLDGKDAIVEAQTGTGKTFAYLLPMLTRIDAGSKNLQAVIIVPTQELGMQIVRLIADIGGERGIRSAALIGGASLARQADRLRLHPQVVVGTPGRMLELLRMGKLKLHEVEMAVIDEADQVIAREEEDGMAVEIRQLLGRMRKDRQLAFVTATVTPELLEAAGEWMSDPLHVRIGAQERVPASVAHHYLVCDSREKMGMLKKALRAYAPKAALVFVSHARQIGVVKDMLNASGFRAEAIYGDAGKLERSEAMRQFREGRCPLLVASDVAARGLDFPHVTHVFHLEPAADANHYVHRSGRTGRMGREGCSVSIVAPREIFILDKFARKLGLEMIPVSLYGGEVLIGQEARNNPAKTGSRAGNVRNAAASRRAKAGIPAGESASRADGGSAGRYGSVQGIPGQKAAETVPRQGKHRGPADGPGQVSRRKKRKEEEFLKKNKGAPRWLKEKWMREGPPES